MKIIKNEKLIARNSKIGNWISIIALVVFGSAMYITITKMEWIIYSFICVFVGYILAQIGMYMGNRWGRSPRPDERIDAGLKGLHSEFNMYHYIAPAPHLLVGPAGVWVLIPFNQSGKVEFNGKRWKLSGGGFSQWYMKIFGQEGLGRPEAEASAEVESVKRFFEKNLAGQQTPEVNALLVFTNEKIELEVSESAVPAIKLKQLKDFMRQKTKERGLSQEQLKQIVELFSSSE